MSEQSDALVGKLRAAGVALQRALARADALEARQREPIAIVGIGCRFPGGADSPDDFWRLLDEGRDAVVPLDERWRLVGERPPEGAPRWAGLMVRPPDQFDAAFFGISPREARSLDPQHRLLLEVAWEALEDAGLPPRSLEGKKAGVFVGACSADYGRAVDLQPEAELDAYCATGNMLSVAAGRLSYTLALNGPCLTVDTACSSSLVAIHLACRSLRAEECEVALAAGVNLILSPATMAGLSRLRALSPDGRCRTFDAAANGFVRGEGCGVLVLKRLQAAKRDGDRIWAVVRGSAVNQDGRSTGLTAPNVLAQEELLREALRDARVEPAQVGYVEAHGTGTSLGDPIEVEALRAVLGAPRADGSRCTLGALKTNIGHLEGAAGVAGVIKAALALRRGRIPANLNFRTQNPRVRLEGSCLELANSARAFPRGGQRRIAGVSSFGISGTNAHVVLEEAPAPAASEASLGAPIEASVDAAGDRRPQLFAVSARSEAALRAQCERLAQHVAAHPEQPLADVAFTLATARDAFEHRAALVARDRAELAAALAAAQATEARRNRGKLAFVFSGQGSQAAGMGRELHARFPAFREAFDGAAALLDAHLPRPLREVMWAGGALLDQTQFTQPALFAFQLALAALWRSWGVEPALLIGHSIGEISAACLAGVFSLEDAARLVCARGRLMQALPGQGAMLAVAASEDAARASLADGVEIAAVNGPAQVVLAGPAASIAAARERFAAAGVRAKELQVSHAFHSAQMEPMLGDLLAVARTLRFKEPALPVASNVRGALASGEIATPEYWVDHARRAARFAGGVRALVEAGAGAFVEIGPRSTLAALLPDGAIRIAASRAGRGEIESALAALGEHWASGGDVRWPALAQGRRVELPHYAWQRARHWISPPARAGAGEPTGHPLLGARTPVAGRGAIYQSQLDAAAQTWLADHRVFGRAILPGAAIAELFCAAGRHARGGEVSVRDLVLRAPVDSSEPRRVQVTLSAAGELELHGQPAASRAWDDWTLHATARIAEPAERPAPADLAAIGARCATALEVGGVYARFAALGLDYGPAFRKLAGLFSGPGEVLAQLAPCESAMPEILDAAMQSAIALLDAGAGLSLPFEIGSFALFGGAPAWAHVRRTAAGAFDVALLDAAGAQVAAIGGLRMVPAEARDAAPDDWYELQWRALPAAASAEKAWTIVRSGEEPIDEAADRVAALFEARPDEAPAFAAQRLAIEGLQLIQRALRRGRPLELAFVTHRAVAAAPDEPVDLPQAALWGLARAAQREHPELGCRLIDLDDRAPLEPALAADDGEPQAAWRNGERLVARLARARSQAASAAPAQKADSTGAPRLAGTVLVTGGTGALGLEVARALAAHGVPHLVLASRQGLAAEGAQRAVDELRAGGARVTAAAVDVADRAALAQLLDGIPDLVGVVHAAGALDDGILLEQSPERFARVFAAKALGAWNLHELTADRALEAFVLFSSVAGLFGSPGQSGYCAANAFLDALAAHRRAQGLAAQSLAWGPWKDAGMAAGLQARLLRQGIESWSAAEGRAIFAAALARSEAQLAPVRLDWRRGSFAAPLFAELAPAREESAAPAVHRALAAHGAPSAMASTAAEVRAAVEAEVARVLSWSGALPADRPLVELGLDSLMAIDLQKALAKRLGRALPATLAFDHPTVHALAEHLARDLPRAPPAKARAQESRDEPIAIIGFGCRYPGGVRDADSFWRLLDEGVDAIGKVPRSRWDADALYDQDPDAAGKALSREGGFVERIEEFDADFFGISPAEAARMDPQQRLLLETSWEALEQAGLAPARLAGSDTGVFVGWMYQEYGNRVRDLGALDGHVITGGAGSIASGRVSYALGLKGPSLTVDTACSSSLVTLHLACQALRRGECSLALAGGVALMLTPRVFVEFSRLRGLAPDGRCKPFSAGADGVGWSEGCGMLALKRLSDAERDGDRVLGVVRGSAVNQDGRSNGLTAPSGPAQEEVIARALAQAGVSAGELGYVECHGTGTALGDPIEAHALGAALGARKEPLPIGSVKSNLGHTQAAAGAAGIIKVLLALEHQRIPRSLHFDAESPHIGWRELPLRVAREPIDWPKSAAPRLAGVSSFGISGTNAHVVIEEPPRRPARKLEASAGAQLFCLSARTDAALREQCVRLEQHLAKHPAPLVDVALTLAAGRSHFEKRISLTAKSLDELRDRLRAVERGQSAAPRKVAFVFSGQGSQALGMGRELAAEWPAFREALERALAAIDRELGRPLADVMWAAPGTAEAALLDQTEFTQPALFAVQYALAALWRSLGVEPALLLGHSIGELTAACFAGALELDDAARLVCARGRLMQALPAGSGMASVAAPEAAVRQWLAGAPALEIAAVNGPASVVVAGPLEALEAARQGWPAKSRQLAVSHAFHSAQMDAILPAFREAAEQVRFAAAALPIVCSVTGRLAGAELSAADYWVRQLRAPVRFADGVRALREAGVEAVLEIGPRGSLLSLVEEQLPDAVLAASRRAGAPEREQILSALGALWSSGVEAKLERAFEGAERVALPSYPFQRKRHWIDEEPAAAPAAEALRELANSSALSEAARAALPELLAALERKARPAEASPFHAIEWRRAPAPSAVARGRWAIVCDDADERQQWAGALARAGATPVALGDARALRELPAVRAIVCRTARVEVALEALRTALALGPSAPRVHLVTRGAAALPERAPDAPEQAAIAGLGRACALEQPQIFGGLVDLAGGSVDDAIAWMASEPSDDEVALTADGPLVPRLAPASAPAARDDARPLHTEGAALITGGLGGIGLHVARHLARGGVKRLLLIGRRGMETPGARAAVASLEAFGASVRVVAADAADREAMARALADEPVTAVFHAAGAADATPLAELDSAHLAQALAAKREGTLILEELTRGRPLDAFVLFSSIAGVWGAAGQAAYSAANAFLDAWAAAARRRGVPALSIAWGPWAGEGLATDEARAWLARRGVRALEPEAALAALDRALASRAAHLVVADVDWQVFRQALEAFRPRPMLAELGAAKSEERAGAGELAAELAQLTPGERAARLEDLVAHECAAVLGHGAREELDRRRGFFDLGLDSLGAVRLAARLRQLLPVRVSAAGVFEHSSVAALAAKLLRDLPEPAAAGASDAAANGANGNGAGGNGNGATDEELLQLISSKYRELS